MIDDVAAAALSRTAAASARPRASLSDYQTFLRMLTVQMQNQDPLNPIDSADYAVQLATFSGVEQQTRTNALLERVLSGMDSAGLIEMAGAVGQEALSTAPAAYDGVTPLNLRPTVDPAAERSVLVVRDAGGAVVSREDLPPATESWTWYGRGTSGAPLPAGKYSFAVESISQGQTVGTSAAPVFAPVEEVRRGEDGLVFVLKGGIALPAGDVLSLRRPPGQS